MALCVVCQQNEAVAGVSRRTGKPYDKCSGCYKNARRDWQQKIGFDPAVRKAQLATFERIWNEAWAAGVAAGNADTPVPMVVVQHANALDDSSPVVRQWGPIPDGSCGFACVCIAPSNCAFSNWLRKREMERGYRRALEYWRNDPHRLNDDPPRKESFDPASDYHRCVMISVHEHRQSYSRKMAHARAVVDYLKQHVGELKTGKTTPSFRVWDKED